MNTKFKSAFAILAISGGMFSLPAQATSVPRMLVDYSAMNDADVFAILTSSGVGACFVQDATAAPTTCNYYFHSANRTPNGYDGVPVYNTDNSSPAGYAGSATASRINQVSGRPLDSTGCFAGAGGDKSGTTQFWIGNNGDESGLTKEAYAKKMLLRMMNDPADPCRLNAYVTAAQSASTSFSAEQAVLATSSYFIFNNATGGVNPRDCRRVQMINGVRVLSPYGSFSETACLTIYRRTLARGDSPRVEHTSTLPTLQYSNSYAYRSAVTAARSAQLAAFAAANPSMFNPSSTQTCTGSVCTAVTSPPQAPTLPNFIPSSQLLYQVASGSGARSQ